MYSSADSIVYFICGIWFRFAVFETDDRKLHFDDPFGRNVEHTATAASATTAHPTHSATDGLSLVVVAVGRCTAIIGAEAALLLSQHRHCHECVGQLDRQCGRCCF